VVAPVGTATVTEEALDAVGVASVVLNLTAVGAVTKLPVIVTVLPIAPLVGVNAGTPGHVADAPVVNAKVAESPVVLCTRTVVKVLGASAGVVMRPTSAWVSASTETNVPVLFEPWLNVTDVMGPPFATVW
jgi:hypothetical protein